MVKTILLCIENFSFVFFVTDFFLQNFTIKIKDNPKIPPKTAELLLVIYNHSNHINGNFDDCFPSKYISFALTRTRILEACQQDAEVRGFLSRSPKCGAGEGDGSGREQGKGSCGGVCPWAARREAKPVQPPASLPLFPLTSQNSL